MISQSRRPSAGSLTARPRHANGARIASTTRRRPTVASPGEISWRTVRFMHDEALTALPQFFESLRIENPLLIGHSDGASIALIHAGAGHAVRGVVAMAPHVFIEPLCLTSIANAAHAFENTDLADKLGRYHREARKTFYGWADVWLDPDFKGWDIRDDYLPHIRCPLLAIQGYDDEYG